MQKHRRQQHLEVATFLFMDDTSVVPDPMQVRQIVGAILGRLKRVGQECCGKTLQRSESSDHSKISLGVRRLNVGRRTCGEGVACSLATVDPMTINKVFI